MVLQLRDTAYPWRLPLSGLQVRCASHNPGLLSRLQLHPPCDQLEQFRRTTLRLTVLGTVDKEMTLRSNNLPIISQSYFSGSNVKQS